ncbi:MAG: peptide ABC transporter substrate-binding protein [Christensenellales bacterium]
MKKLFALLMALCLMVGLVPAMAEGDVVSVFYGGGTPKSGDPALNSASSGSNIIKLSHAGLLGFQWVDGKAEIAPELAESYTISEDQLTWTFTLRKGLKWSDGSDFKASDIVSSWKRAASEELGADYGFMYGIIEGYPANMNITADDENGVFTVKLAAPAPYFKDLAAFPTFYPVKENVDSEGIWATKAETNIGMGPFRMTAYKVDDVISFEKNEYYWNAENVKLASVNCYLAEDNAAILAAYENDTAQFINSIDPVEFDRLNATYPGELVFHEMMGTYYLLFNVYKDMSPAGKQLSVQEQSKARFALGQMVNREELVQFVTKAGQIPAKGFYPTKLSDGTNPDVRLAEGYKTWYADTAAISPENEEYTVDQVSAINALIELGYAYTGTVAEGNIQFSNFPTIEFAFNNSGANAAIIQYVQETWNKVGITSVINQEAWATLQTKLKAGDAEAARMGWVADFSDVLNFLEIFISASGNNYPRLGRSIGDYKRASDVTKDAGMGAYWGLEGDKTWADAYDALANEIKFSTDPAARVKAAQLAEEVLMASGAVAPLFYYTNPAMTKPNVEGLIIMPSGDVIWNYVTLK